MILTETDSDKNVAADLLQNIITLYVKVHSFSFAKDIIQNFKLQGKTHSKAKSLRKEIKKASEKSCDPYFNLAKMAEGNTIRSSASVAISDNKTSAFDNKIEKSSFLFYDAKNFTWKGDLKSLKAFVATIMKCDNGKWSSPREEEKLFKNDEFSLKWFGPKKKKLQIMKDNQMKSLQTALEESAQANGVKIQDEKTKTATHVDDGSQQQQQDPKLQHVDENHSVCGNCEEYRHQIANIMTLVAEIKSKQQEESQRAISDSAKLEITIKTLSAQNNKMAAELELLKSGMSELSGDNASIKRVLDMKQNEWTKVTEKTKKLNNPAVKNTDKIDPRPNTFQVLQDVEETSPTSAQNYTEAYQTRGPSKDNLTRYRKLPEFKDKKTRKGRCSTGGTSTKSTTKCDQPKHEKAVLVIGDSMVKHIDGNKIGRAARSKAICHSYTNVPKNRSHQTNSFTLDIFRNIHQINQCQISHSSTETVHIYFGKNTQ